MASASTEYGLLPPQVPPPKRVLSKPLTAALALGAVALGTVADVAALHGLNRAFVAQGLKVMAKRQNVGMSALIDASRLTRAPVCSDLGFALGPRINAGGRVGESTLGVRLLTTEDVQEAQAIAAQLSALNEERRAIEAAVQEAAEEQLAGQHNRAVAVLAVVSGLLWLLRATTKIIEEMDRYAPKFEEARGEHLDGRDGDKMEFQVDSGENDYKLFCPEEFHKIRRLDCGGGGK